MRGFKGIVVGMTLALAGSAAAETRLVDGPGAGGVILRDGPGTLDRVVQTMARGTRVDLQETYEGWGLVTLPNGVQGWALARHLKRPGQFAHATPKPVDVTPIDVDERTAVVWPKAGNLNLRGGPGTGHDVLMVVPRGDWVEVFQTAGAWAHVRCMTGDEGWVHSAYLKM